MCFCRFALPLFLMAGFAAGSLNFFPAVAVAGEIEFNRDIRPILAENCFYCHGQDENKRQGDLRLDAPNEATEWIVDRILSDDPDTQMPPPNSNRTLSDVQKVLLEKWVKEGAPYAEHWAFVSPTRPPVPDTATNDAGNHGWPKNPIDQFVLKELIDRNLQPSPEADRATLIKRLYSDLVGLPPSPDEVKSFVVDPDPLAYERLVDRLLESRHYGERLSLPWLDAARYADSNGFQQDGDTWQWIWRDWVVRALNDDMPFDQFTVWQLAGDLLPDATTDQKIASGFNRNHLLNGEGGAIAEEQRFNILFDRIDTTTTTWLGLTMACAQCHDHKYDPITQRDYYRLVDAFNRVPESGTPQFFSSRIRVGNPVIELPTEENNARISEFESKIADLEKQLAPKLDIAWAGWKLGIEADGNAADVADLPTNLADAIKKPAAEQSDDEKKKTQNDLRKFFDEKVKATLKSQFTEIGEIESLRNQLNGYRADQIPRVMVMSDAKPRDTHILDRGQYLQPLEKVPFGTPAFLPPLADDAPQSRLGLAQWLVADNNPLTARVQVNRMWQYFFGVGIVKTAEDFGVQSEYPIHKDLLDWLAVEFQLQGWSMKHMHRLIVTSATYRQSSRVSETLLEVDRENRLYARATRFRMPAMVLRDWALATAGLLDKTIGGKPVYPYQPDAVWESLAITKERDFTYPESSGSDLFRRSLYTFWRRTVNPANMFDSANRQTCQVRTSITSTPLHALTTLNDPTWVEASRSLAQNVIESSDQLDRRLSEAFERILCRRPNEHERTILTGTFEKQLAMFTAAPESAEELLAVGKSSREPKLDTAQHAAMTMVCLAIYNLDEALTRE